MRPGQKCIGNDLGVENFGVQGFGRFLVIGRVG